MKNILKFIIAVLTITMISSCGGSAGSNSNSVSYGTIAFSKSAVTISSNGQTSNTITLQNSSNIKNDLVNLTSNESTVAMVTPSQCTISSSQPQCVVTIKGVSVGSAQIAATSVYSGYTYTITPVAVTVSSGVVGVAGVSMSVNGITETIYSGKSYNPIFTFTNNTGAAITLGQANITNSGANLGIALDPAPCSNQPLANGASCSISGSGIVTPVNNVATLDFVLNDSVTKQSYSFNMDIAAVTQYANYAAYRITNHNNPGHKLYIVALGLNSSSQQSVVQFDSSGKGSLLPQSSPYSAGTLEVPASALGLVLYQPNYSGSAGGIGGVMYASLDKSIPITSGGVSPAPWTSGDPSQGITFSQYEPNVWTNASTGVLNAILDITDINFAGLTQGFYGMDAGSGNNLKSGFLAESYASLSTSEVYNQMQTTLQTGWPTSWGVSSTFYLSSTNPNSWVMLLGLVNWLGQNPIVYPNGFNQNLYTQYVDDLWTYYSSHTMYIDAGEISAGCVLQATTTSPSEMTVSPVNAAQCPTSAGGPNTWTWTKFNASDFVGGAAGSSSTLWGSNGTYRSMGKYVSAAQSVGFLPYCTKPDLNFIYGPDTLTHSPANQANYWTNQYGSCLANSASYGDSVMNQYDKIFHQYIPLNYGWAYDDALGISSAVTIDATKSGFTMEVHQF